MTLKQSALLELTDVLRSADGGQVMRLMLSAMLQALVDAEATAHIGADLYEHTPTRTAQHRFTDTPLPARGDPARVAPEGRKAIAVKIETGDAPPMQMHPDQLPVSLGVVRELVDQQFPEWQGLPISEVASHGTVNALFRIGDKFVARFPLEPEEVTATRRWLESEAQAARELSGCTRFLTPEPVALGEPVAGYPLPWAVQTWLPGTVATVEDPGESVGFAHDLS